VSLINLNYGSVEVDETVHRINSTKLAVGVLAVAGIELHLKFFNITFSNITFFSNIISK